MIGACIAIAELAPGGSIVGELSPGRELSTLTFRLALTTYAASVRLGSRAAGLIWARDGAPVKNRRARFVRSSNGAHTG